MSSLENGTEKQGTQKNSELNITQREKKEETEKIKLMVQKESATPR